jgi:hypothetical protein
MKMSLTQYAEMIWNVMGKTGKGYMKDSMKRNGKDKDIRGDKVDSDGNRISSLARRYQHNTRV